MQLDSYSFYFLQQQLLRIRWTRDQTIQQKDGGTYTRTDGQVTRRFKEKMGERIHGRMDKWQDNPMTRGRNAHTDGWTTNQTIQRQEGGTHTRTGGQVTRQSNGKRVERTHGWTDNWPGEPMQQINNPPKWRNEMAGGQDDMARYCGGAVETIGCWQQEGGDKLEG